MESIIWYNKNPGINAYNEIRFIARNMNGTMPLYGTEKKHIYEYAQRKEIPVSRLLSIRNTIKIQKEIIQSKLTHENEKMILEKFDDLVTSKKITQEQLKLFINSTKLNVLMVIKIIERSLNYNLLTVKNINYLKKICKKIIENNKNITEKASQFEIMLEDYLKQKYNLSFITERELRKQKNNVATPDFLFIPPIKILFNNEEYIIHWIDAKDYFLFDSKFLLIKLKKQMEKYNKHFGMGAFVFHYGYDTGTVDFFKNNVLILDYPEL